MYKDYYNDVEKLYEIIRNSNEKSDEVFQICKKNNELFGKFFIEFLDFFKVKLDDILYKFRKNNCIELIEKNIIISVLNSLIEDLLNVSGRTLIAEINIKREENLLIGETSKSRYNFFNELLLNDKYKIELLKKYPVLAYLIYTKIFNKLEVISELLERLVRDYAIIKSELNMDFKVIQNINFSSGDTHNGGKSVLIIVTDKGKIVYKPHSLSPEKMFGEIIDFINKKETLKIKVNKIRTIDFNGYGWQEFAEYKSCKNLTEVCNYFYKIGVELAIFHMLGCDDLHYENLIACGENPVFIDLETLLKNNSSDTLYSENLTTVFNQNINDSVLGTMLLPLNVKGSVFDYDMGGISSYGDQKSNFWKSYVIENAGTDEIRLNKKSINIGDSYNKVMLNEEVMEPIDFNQDIHNGFFDCYRLILDNKTDLIKFINLIKNVEVRQVLRATAVYARFLEAATHPSYLTDFKEREMLLSKIRVLNQETTENLKNKNLYEIDALMDNDIPYFTTYLWTNDLVCNNKVKIRNYYNSTLSEILLDRVQSLSEINLKKQLYYIRMSLATTVKDIWKKESLKENSNITYFKNKKSYIECAKELGDLFCETAIWSKDKNTCTWLTQIIAKEDKFELGPLNYSLYEGGGVILFLNTLAKETGESKYSKVSMAGMKGIEEIYLQHSTNQLQPSLFQGIGSLIYIYYSIYSLNDDKDAYSKYIKYLKELSEYDIDKTALDVISGVSGLIIVLLNIYSKEKSELLLTTCDKLGKVLYESLLEDNLNHFTGLSHGYAGFSWALILLGKYVNNNNYLELGKKLIEIENEKFNKDKLNWKDIRTEDKNVDHVLWCHGASGIALSRANLLNCLDDKDTIKIQRDLELAIKKLTSEGFTDELDHSICHGIFGNIDILLKLSQILNDRMLLEQAYKEADKALKYIRTKGIKCGMKKSFDISTFMIGLSGIGYVLLRLHNPRYASVLSLEVLNAEVL
ncbi:type 2 lanthipeptide synthetase LanM family protein [Clostridium frigidicarnis]|uniref:Type 2 lantibiotic biosynthesis protein LanM n=1 Tax=Clostridium frigidicarnis TaxID=84698 RepID=A0A1I1BB62_9CLOT|nr:type 2 lanthipeptide synthetase LanM family protein [Clostridium frigidicarnis]SFB45753.1 type 2 lantibiotic biosynthesis protein LanM [Clostridium frigidicarnis]